MKKKKKKPSRAEQQKRWDERFTWPGDIESKADAERERLRNAEEKERLRTAPIVSIERLSDYQARIAKEGHE